MHNSLLTSLSHVTEAGKSLASEMRLADIDLCVYIELKYCHCIGHCSIALSWLKQRVIDWFCQGLMEPLKEMLLVLPILCGKVCSRKMMLQAPTVYLSSTTRGDSLPYRVECPPDILP